jgi:hypothetical protein
VRKCGSYVSFSHDRRWHEGEVGDRGEEWSGPRISPVVLTVAVLGAMADGDVSTRRMC